MKNRLLAYIMPRTGSMFHQAGSGNSVVLRTARIISDLASQASDQRWQLQPSQANSRQVDKYLRLEILLDRYEGTLVWTTVNPNTHMRCDTVLTLL